MNKLALRKFKKLKVRAPMGADEPSQHLHPSLYLREHIYMPRSKEPLNTDAINGWFETARLARQEWFAALADAFVALGELAAS